MFRRSAVTFCIMLHCTNSSTAVPKTRSTMSERDMEAKLLELDRLLNDPEVRMDPHRVWSLLQEISTAGKPAVPRAA
jgi:hypothetical protein